MCLYADCHAFASSQRLMFQLFPDRVLHLNLSIKPAYFSQVRWMTPTAFQIKMLAEEWFQSVINISGNVKPKPEHYMSRSGHLTLDVDVKSAANMPPPRGSKVFLKNLNSKHQRAQSCAPQNIRVTKGCCWYEMLVLIMRPSGVAGGDQLRIRPSQPLSPRCRHGSQLTHNCPILINILTFKHLTKQARSTSEF